MMGALLLAVAACERPKPGNSAGPGQEPHASTLELGPARAASVMQGVDARLLVPVRNLGEDDLITGLTASCGCTQVLDTPEALKEGSYLKKGASVLEFRVNTSGTESPIKGSITLEMASGRTARADYEVSFTPGIEVEKGPIVMEGPPGQAVKRRFWMRFPPGEEGRMVMAVTAKHYRLQTTARANPQQAGEWLIDLTWQPGPEAKSFTEEIQITTDLLDQVVSVPVEARLVKFLTVEPTSWVLGDIYQKGTQKLTFTLEAADGQAFAVTHWDMVPAINIRTNALAQPHAAKLTVDLEVDMTSYANVMSGQATTNRGQPVVAYWMLQTDHPKAPLIKVPLIAVAPQ